MFLRQSGEQLVLSYLVSHRISTFSSLRAATTNALQNLKRCTVGITDRWSETETIAKFKFPWMAPPRLQKESPLSNREDPSSLNPLIQGILINRLMAEMFLYEKALQIFDQQLKNAGLFHRTNKEADALWDNKHENYYRHFIPSPFPF